MCSLFDLTIVEGRLAIPTRQRRLRRRLRGLLKNSLQLLLHMLWNAIHG